MDEQPRLHLRLHQIILRALMHRLHREPFVVQATHDNDGYLRRGGVGALEGVRHGAVRERKIQQHQINAALVETFEPLGQCADVLEIKHGAGWLGQVFAHQAGITGIVLDEEHPALRVGRGGVHFGLCRSVGH